MSKYLVKTFGCQMNKHDSERIAGVLQKAGYEQINGERLPDIIVFNTCCVREHAEEKLFSNVGALKKEKQKNPNLVIAVGGCLAQKEGENVLKRLPHVDVVFGTHNLSSLPDLIRKSQRENQVCEILKGSAYPATRLPRIRKRQLQAWVVIMTGCDNYCSYCVVPEVRGREASRPLDEIVSEVETLAEDGVLEVTLLGQNVNSYGRDIYGKPRFAKLIRKLNQVKEIKHIRFTTSHPKDLTDEVISAIRDSEKVCKHIHLPFQAGSNKILNLMNRGYTKEQYLELVERIRNQIPKVSITTDIMVGFPKETEEDFGDTMDVVERVRFDQAYMFIYSPRAGTKSYELENTVTEGTKKKWFNRLVSKQEQITLENNLAYQGAVVEVLVEGVSKKDELMLSGKTRTAKIVNFSGARGLIGSVVKVRIYETRKWCLVGEVI